MVCNENFGFRVLQESLGRQTVWNWGGCLASPLGGSIRVEGLEKAFMNEILA